MKTLLKVGVVKGEIINSAILSVFSTKKTEEQRKYIYDIALLTVLSPYFLKILKNNK